MNGNRGYRLGITCCFCGGALEIDEASRTTKCGHCASLLKIVREGVPRYFIRNDLARREVKFLIDRHLKKTDQPLVSRWIDVSRIYLPFWRTTGTVFCIQEKPDPTFYDIPVTQEGFPDRTPGLEVKITQREVTSCANQDRDWAIASLGIRTQVVKLEPLDRRFGESNHLIVSSLTSEDAMQRFDKSVASTAAALAPIGTDVQVNTVSREAALIYFPLWLAGFTNSAGRHIVQFDPLAKRVVSMANGELDIPPADTTGPNDTNSIRIVPHRCPNCGHDLPDNPRSVTYYCGNCRRLFLDQWERYKRIKIRIPTGLDSECTLFPFWVFNLSDLKGPGKVELLADILHLRFSADRFYVPAFGVANPLRMLRLVTHYNKREDVFTFEEHPASRYSFAAVSCSPEQAIRLMSAFTSAARAVEGFRISGAKVAGEIKTTDPELVWLPYTPDRYFWRENITGATIEKAVTRTSRP